MSILSVEPKLEELSDRPFNLKDWLNLAATLASATLILMDFHSESHTLYTPKGVPGRDKLK